LAGIQLAVGRIASGLDGMSKPQQMMGELSGKLTMGGEELAGLQLAVGRIAPGSDEMSKPQQSRIAPEDWTFFLLTCYNPIDLYLNPILRNLILLQTWFPKPGNRL